MAKLMDGRKARVRNLVLVLALGYLPIMVIGNPTAAAQRPGDTPVVLIGGSVDSKAGGGGSGDWQEKTKYKDYVYAADYKATVVALKETYTQDGPKQDDSNPKTDNNKIAITDPTWQILLYTKASPTTSVAHLEPQADGIHIILDDANGYLCQSANQIRYQPAADCSKDKKPMFSTIDLVAGGKTVGTLSCMSTTGKKNKCRFVLR